MNTTERRNVPPAVARNALFLIFAVSGFAALIYESIWTQYLKLMLGHAAYAQTLVLAIFMGGMAAGSWICGQLSPRIAHPLLAYAGVEFTLALLGLAFDPVFRAGLAFVIERGAPALADPLSIDLLKWTLASLLILPGCVLLGATFPLISAAVIRLGPSQPGNSLGWLYFTNSLGGVIGVLASGFVLISAIGLPGTLLTAAACNTGLAALTYALGRRVTAHRSVKIPSTSRAEGGAPPRIDLLMTTAFLTGAASFLYEIGWIRMLSLVLGSATHSFELMLAAFIFGLAMGALWIRNRIGDVSDPWRTLGWVQVLMGTLALTSLVGYRWSFDAMAAIVATLERTETGFTWFSVGSMGICVLLMVPITFLAGMTLPLITTLAIRGPRGESAIGRIYAANTLGSIVGVVLAVHLVMPLLGLRNVIVVGAAIDVTLGLVVFRRSGPLTAMNRLGVAILLLVSAAITAIVRFDPYRLSSGVFRTGLAEKRREVLFHEDGRTASVDITRALAGYESILTNGKPDAALMAGHATDDDYTMVLLGIIPLAFRPDAQDVAVIGLGSGRTAHTLLGSPHLRNLDTIEIEPAIARGARLFGPLVERTFADPRNKIHFEDAKTFFARHQKQYDIIISEPSNPWVSGVASLFTDELYQQIRRHLSPGGIFVQWLQLYEFNDALVASIGQALDRQFEDYAFYITNVGDLAIIAVPSGTLGPLTPDVLAWEEIKPLADSIRVRTLADLQARQVGNRESLGPWFAAKGVPTNSDYFPYVDQGAARARFEGSSADALPSANAVISRMTDQAIPFDELTPTRWAPMASAVEGARYARYLSWRFGKGRTAPPQELTQMLASGMILGGIVEHCEDPELRAVWQPALEAFALTFWPYLTQDAAHRITTVLRGNVCTGNDKAYVDRWLNFLDAVTERRWDDVSRQGAALVVDAKLMGPSTFVVRELLLADYRRLGISGVALRLQLLGKKVPNDPSIRYFQTIAG